MTRWLKYGFVLCVAVLLASASGAATLRVERDGTGDYTTIQPALDAVAAGDTVLIGPGEYPEMTNQYLPNAGGWFEVAGCIRVSNITLIGDSAETTLIGPAVYSGEVNIDSAVKTRYSGTLPNQIGGRRRHAVRAPISPFIDQKRDHAA